MTTVYGHSPPTRTPCTTRQGRRTVRRSLSEARGISDNSLPSPPPQALPAPDVSSSSSNSVVWVTCDDCNLQCHEDELLRHKELFCKRNQSQVQLVVSRKDNECFSISVKNIENYDQLAKGIPKMT